MSEKFRGKVLKWVFVAGFSANGEPSLATFPIEGGGSREFVEAAGEACGIGVKELSAVGKPPLDPENMLSSRDAAVMSPRLKPRLRTRLWLASMGCLSPNSSFMR